ncbi:MAG TPA: ABC transporter permease, partial [Chitinophagaceae bacterium]|nr:ABC transporter permease [Chitinophagaceae bacterium]
MFKNYFRTAFRTLLRNKTYSIVNVVGLSLGLACAMLIILYVEDEISYDRFHQNVSHIYRVNRKIIRDNGNIDYSGYTGLFQGPKFTASVPEIQAFVRFKNGQTDIKNGTDIHLQEVFYADSNFFSVFSFPLLKGNPKSALREPNSVVITEEVAKKQFGTTDVLGKTLLLKNDSTFVPYAITGVAKKCPQNSSIKFQVLLPLRTSQQDEQQNENWFNFFLNTFVVLAPHADVKSVESKMKIAFERDASESIKMIQQTYGKKDIGLSYFLQPFSEIHLTKNVAEAGLSDTSDPVYSYILSGI